MQPNNVFNAHRMQLYLQKHFTDHYRFYGMGMLTIFGLMTGIGVLMVTVGRDPFHELSNMVPFYYIGLFFGGTLFTSRAFNELGSKEKGVDFLMLPASQFEKFITLFLISSLGFFIAYHISCYLSFMIVEKVQKAATGLPIAKDYLFLDHPKEKVYIYYGYFILQAAFLLGATYFHKYSFIKTVLSIFVFAFALWLINCVIVTLIFGFGNEFWKRSVPFLLVSKLEGGPVAWHTTLYLIPKWLQDTYLFTIKFVIAPVLWTIAYFRLKDQEI
ncbi:hypothetical protein [Chitinophaga sp.]|uniref:hypothetical protein n=1 Tax=Chitinophaga sp. TaxID=1869181 RepID=UPI002B67C837|nr:hypothetical protein [Chitinophaga sp.]HWV64984.1 hypothetical protein [Chitinophaga sp.]